MNHVIYSLYIEFVEIDWSKGGNLYTENIQAGEKDRKSQLSDWYRPTSVNNTQKHDVKKWHKILINFIEIETKLNRDVK